MPASAARCGARQAPSRATLQRMVVEEGREIPASGEPPAAVCPRCGRRVDMATIGPRVGLCHCPVCEVYACRWCWAGAEDACPICGVSYGPAAVAPRRAAAAAVAGAGIAAAAAAAPTPTAAAAPEATPEVAAATAAPARPCSRGRGGWGGRRRFAVPCHSTRGRTTTGAYRSIARGPCGDRGRCGGRVAHTLSLRQERAGGRCGRGRCARGPRGGVRARPAGRRDQAAIRRSRPHPARSARPAGGRDDRADPGVAAVEHRRGLPADGSGERRRLGRGARRFGDAHLVIGRRDGRTHRHARRTRRRRVPPTDRSGRRDPAGRMLRDRRPVPRRFRASVRAPR